MSIFTTMPISEEKNERLANYKSIKGKLTTFEEAIVLVHFFRLTMGEISTTRLKEKPIEIASGDIYCFVDDIGNILRWSDSLKWTYSKITRPFLDFEENERRLMKRTITLGFGDHKYHLINYFSKNDKNLKPFGKNDIIKSLSLSLKLNKCIMSDGFLFEKQVGIDYFYGRRGLNIVNDADRGRKKTAVDSYCDRLYKFLDQYSIGSQTSNFSNLTEMEKDAAQMLYVLSNEEGIHNIDKEVQLNKE